MDLNKLVDIVLAGKDAIGVTDPMAPGILSSVKLANSIYGYYLSQRRGRLIELIQESVQEIPENVWKDERFQDGFVFLLERYLRERSYLKRQTMKNILLGFSEHYQNERFEYEKLLSVLERISVEDLETLRQVPLSLDINSRFCCAN